MRGEKIMAWTFVGWGQCCSSMGAEFCAGVVNGSGNMYKLFSDAIDAVRSEYEDRGNGLGRLGCNKFVV